MAAMEVEVKPLTRKLRPFSNSPTLYTGKLGEDEVFLILSGVGPQRAEEVARRVVEKGPRLVIGLGFAGGLASWLKAGSLFAPREARNLIGDRFPCLPVNGHGEVAGGVLLTMDRIVQTREEKKALSGLADAVDMETFPLARAMSRHGIPFLSIRGISDPADEELPLDFCSALETGQVSPWEVIGQMARKPSAILPILRLASRSGKLSRELHRFSLELLSARPW